MIEQDVKGFFRTNPHTRNSPSYTAYQYVRDAHTFTVSVVWSIKPPERLPQQRFLCPVPTEELKTFCQSCDVTSLVWGEDAWETKTPAPGDVVWLPLDAGGYSHDRGWTADPTDKPQAYSLEVEPEYNDPPFSHNLPLETHLRDTEDFLREFIPHLKQLGLPESLIEELCLCVRWHDWGKAHEIWQAYANNRGELLAKSTDYNRNPRVMKGYRHELASAFAAAVKGVPFRVQYLIAAHHGKVRDSLQPTNLKEPFNPKVLRGVELGTHLPSIEIKGIETLPPVKLSFPGKVGDWDRQVKGLLREYGPFKLIYLEALIRNADIKASNYREKEARNDNSND